MNTRRVDRFQTSTVFDFHYCFIVLEITKYVEIHVSVEYFPVFLANPVYIIYVCVRVLLDLGHGKGYNIVFATMILFYTYACVRKLRVSTLHAHRARE